MRRDVTPHHHDGHGLNESLKITSDAKDPAAGGASHHYLVYAGGPDCFGPIVASVQFQHGPRNEANSHAGITEAVLLAILIDRLEGFQAGPYACPENDEQLLHLRAALALTKARADARAARGVLGRNAK